MKTTLVMFFFFITGVAYSQIHYVEVSPKYVKQYEHNEGYFDNSAHFLFDIKMTMESIRATHCTITGYVYDIPLHNKITVRTGWDYEYTEDETVTDSSGYFKVTVSTDNLPKLAISVNYNGEPVDIKLSDVDIYFSGNKY